MVGRGPTAKTILKKSIEDIEAGHWCQGHLGGKKREDEPLAGEACAVGLLSMHGGYGRKRGKWFYPKYPDGGAPKGVREAVKALYEALPKTRRILGDEEDPVQAMSNPVISYNDQDYTNAKKAAAWFRRALESLSA